MKNSWNSNHYRTMWSKFLSPSMTSGFKLTFLSFRIKAAFEEYMRINGRKIPASYPSANPEQILPLSPTKSESPKAQRKTNQQQQQPLSPENKLPKPVKVSPTEALVKPSLLQAPAAGKPRQIQAPRQLYPAGKQTPEQTKDQLPRPVSNKSPVDSTATLESPVSATETNKPKSKLPQSRLPKSSTLSKLGAHPAPRNGNQAKSDEDINATQKSGSCNQLQSLAASNSKSKLVAPSKVVVNKEENSNKIEKRYSDQTLEQRFSPKQSDSFKANEQPMIKQKSKSKLVAPGFTSKVLKSSSTENITSQNGSHDNLQNGVRSNSQSKPLQKRNQSEEDLVENDAKKQALKTGIKKPTSPKNERPLSGGMEGVCRIPAPKSRIARSTGIPSRKTPNQP
ncbi:AT-rich interactive domain-containing protein 1A-like isoform X2 [Anneissia japonica]|uniref:AT-rich interactive domain-containing protein 1A-like isoform X2 n=1 Tax=Anneissia japonica TaxID=1529436 RepID=UPI0014259578|nr:AT-rich interactive domain-containing protein 1A-like isoform X2 [Anneissia japonica]